MSGALSSPLLPRSGIGPFFVDYRRRRSVEERCGRRGSVCIAVWMAVAPPFACVLYPLSCFLFPVSFIPCPVTCIPCPVSYFLCPLSFILFLCHVTYFCDLFLCPVTYFCVLCPVSYASVDLVHRAHFSFASRSGRRWSSVINRPHRCGAGLCRCAPGGALVSFLPRPCRDTPFDTHPLHLAPYAPHCFTCPSGCAGCACSCRIRCLRRKLPL